MAKLNLVEASIEDLQRALSLGVTTSVELFSLCLRRISIYDCRGPLLNAIPVLNPDVFEEVAASDQRRRQGYAPRALEGIQFTVKDIPSPDSVCHQETSRIGNMVASGQDKREIEGIDNARDLTYIAPC